MTEPQQRTSRIQPAPQRRPQAQLKLSERKRLGLQVLFFALSNGYWKGWFTGRIYQGSLKNVCLPGLNCYSCPGALGACPIGSLQSSLYDSNQIFPFYVLGFLFLFGSLLGRAVCGFLCPFGLVQDLLARLNKRPYRPALRLGQVDRRLRWLKQLILFVLVIGLPLLSRTGLVAAYPWFCKFLCPSGTVLAGWPLTIMEAKLHHLLGWLFGWKSLLAILILAGSVIIPRFFCRYLCPLGAFLGYFNKIALYRLSFQPQRCINCGACARVCPMEVAMPDEHQSAECVRCGRCSKICPTTALHCGFARPSLPKLSDRPH